MSRITTLAWGGSPTPPPIFDVGMDAISAARGLEQVAQAERR